MFKFLKFHQKEQLYPKYKADYKWAFMRGVDIMIDGEVYLRRFILFKCPWFGLYLHKFLKGDQDKCKHDHPWAFYTFILTHGYNEEVAEGVFFRKPLRLYYRPPEWAHRVILEDTDPKPMTLLLIGPKVREWGFLTKQGWVHWSDFKAKNVDKHLC